MILLKVVGLLDTVYFMKTALNGSRLSVYVHYMIETVCLLQIFRLQETLQ